MIWLVKELFQHRQCSMRRYCFRFPILLSHSPRLPTFSDSAGASSKGDFYQNKQAENSSFTSTVRSKETHKRIPITVRYCIWEAFASPTRAILCQLGYIQLASVTFALIFFFIEYFLQWKDPAATTGEKLFFQSIRFSCASSHE